MLLKRDTTIDILRGLAIFAMIGANMIPVLYRGTPPAFFRLYSSFAAPTFIFLSGMMVSFAVIRRKHSSVYFFKRAMVLLITGALIDVFITGIYPFMTFDVLYLIGFSMPLTLFFKKLKTIFQYILVISIFAATPLLQHIIGYQQMPVEISLYITGNNISVSIGTILRQWFVDGWFPIFPWLGFAFLGSIAADIRLKYKSFSNSMALFIAFVLLISGEIIWVKNPGWMFVRNGYCELFYPATPGFILTSTGVILILFCIIDIKNELNIYRLFSTLGKWSLQIYILHLLVISLLGKVIEPQGTGTFLLIYIGIVILLFTFFSVLNKIRLPDN